MSYRAIIIEDEAKTMAVLDIKIKTLCPEITVVAQADNIENAYIEINEHKPDLIFLDVEMPGGTGFDLLARFDEITFEIIITTGYNKYGLQALKISAVDYLLKPINSDELQTAVQNAKEKIENRIKRNNYALLKHNLKYLNDQRTKITITHLGEIFYIAINNIIRYEAYERYTYIYTTDNVKLFSTLGISIYDDLLLPFGFCRCHKSHTVNGKHIKKYFPRTSTIRLSDLSEVPVARRKKKLFEEFVLTIK